MAIILNIALMRPVSAMTLLASAAAITVDGRMMYLSMSCLETP